MPNESLGTVLMVALTVALPGILGTTLWFSNPTTTSCSWEGAGTYGLQIHTCEERGRAVACDGYLHGHDWISHTHEDGTGETHFVAHTHCHGHWTTPDPDTDEPQRWDTPPVYEYLDPHDPGRHKLPGCLVQYLETGHGPYCTLEPGA